MVVIKKDTKVENRNKPGRILIREEYCMGCKLCEVNCLVQHSKTKNIIKAYKTEFPRPKPGVIVEENGYVSFALQCRHCDDAPCLEACMTSAMHRDKDTGAVICDTDKCVGCWMCIMVCPYGAIARNTEGKKVASKCDLCKGESVPVCVKNCPNEAIIYEK
jgi:carbon-monoxide dehydrogenase iron sulfur subunit